MPKCLGFLAMLALIALVFSIIFGTNFMKQHRHFQQLVPDQCGGKCKPYPFASITVLTAIIPATGQGK